MCARVESGKPLGEAGWIHYLPEGEVQPVVARVQHKYLNPDAVHTHWSKLRARGSIIKRQASLLGLSYQSLLSFNTRYDGKAAVLVFPMFDHLRRMTGLRYRRADGRKWALKGGREGIFRPRGFDPRQPVFIVEGPTDAAAAIDIGLHNVIGRPSCTGGATVIRDMFAKHPHTPLIFLADPDGPGLTGAERLASTMCSPSLVLAGPMDLRDFVLGSELKSKARRAIMEGVDGDEHTEWRPVFHNQLGLLCDFRKHLDQLPRRRKAA